MTSPAYDDDVALIAAVALRDSDAWTTFVNEYEPTIRYAIVHAVARFQAAVPDADIDDLVADLMLHLVRSDCARLRKYNARSSLRHWLKVVASNFAIDHLRRRRPTYGLSTLGGTPEQSDVLSADAFVDPSPLPDTVLVDREKRAAVVDLFSTLSAEDRAFVELYYARGLSYEEVARLMGTTLGAVYTRRNRIRKRLTATARERNLIG